ncbi:MAG: extracellular solute-binding protein, partial [Selenomonas sp.]|nr:extracellular solute-binding protein [Selenomonas sp.]
NSSVDGTMITKQTSNLSTLNNYYDEIYPNNLNLSYSILTNKNKNKKKILEIPKLKRSKSHKKQDYKNKNIGTIVYEELNEDDSENLYYNNNNWAVTRDTDGDGRIDQFGVYDYTWRIAALTNGVKFFSADGRTANLADKKMEEVLRFMQEIHEVNQGQEVQAKDFDMGKVAFRPFTFAEYRTYKPYPWRIKKYSSFEWDCIKLPAGPSGRNSSLIQPMIMGISARSHEQRLAWELLKTICYDPAVQELMLTKTQGLPARRDVVESPQAQALFNEATPGSEEMNLKTVSEVMDDSITPSKFARCLEALHLADNKLQHIIREKDSLSSALSQVQKEINAYLQQ